MVFVWRVSCANGTVLAKGRRKRVLLHLLVFSPRHRFIFSEPDLQLVTSIYLLEIIDNLLGMLQGFPDGFRPLKNQDTIMAR